MSPGYRMWRAQWIVQDMIGFLVHVHALPHKLFGALAERDLWLLLSASNPPFNDVRWWGRWEVAWGGIRWREHRRSLYEFLRRSSAMMNDSVGAATTLGHTKRAQRGRWARYTSDLMGHLDNLCASFPRPIENVNHSYLCFHTHAKRQTKELQIYEYRINDGRFNMKKQIRRESSAVLQAEAELMSFQLVIYNLKRSIVAIAVAFMRREKCIAM